ncbi:MAG: hypothetical protein R3B06_12190 [Kofleriaceae bacterium]
MTVRRSPLSTVGACLLAAVTAFACGKKEGAPAAGSATPPPSGSAAPTPAGGTAPAPAPAGGVAAAAPIPGEVDPSATSDVKPIDLTAADLEGVELAGKREHVVGWTDKNGTGALIITTQPQRDNGGLLVATLLYREGDGSWTTDRELKELVDACEFDLTLAAQVGDWTVRDLDGDGRADITVAWNAGCRSDVSPITHKVLVVSKGEKYALRGDTLTAGVGGTFKADPAFKGAPPALLAHAEQVWKATVDEGM